MRYTAAFSIGIIALPFFAFSQRITFCEKTDAMGKAMNSANAFTLSQNGGQVTLLFTTAAVSEGGAVNFDLYRLDHGKEIFQSSMKQSFSDSKTWAAKQVTFYNDGRYRVYVFDEHDKQLAESDLEIRK